MNDLNEREYNSFLKKADGNYGDFESTFGPPPLDKNIGKADAFRWVCHQLTKRIDSGDWREIWSNAWLTEGWIISYRAEFSKVKSILEDVVDSLRAEKKKMIFSAVPLHSNFALHKNYEMVLSGLETLLNDCSMESLEHYREWKYDEDITQLVLYSMAIAYLVTKILESICLVDELDI